MERTGTRTASKGGKGKGGKVKTLAVAGLLLSFAGCAFKPTLAKEEPPKIDNWERSRECAHQAAEVFKGWNADDTYTSFTNHYSPALNRCFAMYTSFHLTQQGDFVSHAIVQDAFERKEVAAFNLFQGRGPVDAKPDPCYVISATSGASQLCATRSEFDKLVKAYME